MILAASQHVNGSARPSRRRNSPEVALVAEHLR